VDWSFFANPDVLKVGAAALGFGASALALIDRLISRRRQPSTQSPPISQTLNFFFGGGSPINSPTFLKTS
jgi:hypothetical protein